MDQRARALIVVPTYGEAEDLVTMASEVAALPLAFGLLVIDGNSPDGTGKITDRLAQERAAPRRARTP